MQTPTMTTYKYRHTCYRLNGKLHRLDGPAYISADGEQHWRINGKLHREDGPAFIGADGTQFWYINGNSYTFSNYCKKLNLLEEDIVFLKLKYNTCVTA